MAIDWSKVESPLQRQERPGDELVEEAAASVREILYKDPNYIAMKAFVAELRRLREHGIPQDRD
mgnify:CR=1 FL=1